MKTLRKVKIDPVFVEFIPEKLEQDKLYISKEYATASHLCLCGCESLIVTPIGENWWNLIERGDKVTLSPSIGNYYLPCDTHYIIVDNVANFV